MQIRSSCDVCRGIIYFQECPYGGWWYHAEHPEDDHDAHTTELVITQEMNDKGYFEVTAVAHYG